MRVIRTEMVFEDVESIGPGVSKAARLNPGVGVAFFNVTPPPDFSFRSILKKPIVYSGPNEREVRRFLDLCIRGNERSYGRPHSKYWADDVRNVAIVNFLMDANIVIEESPPSWEQLKSLVSKSPGIGIGTFVGFQIAGTHTELMIITVPIGIIVVSSAIGVSEALKKGLNKKVEALFKDKPRLRGSRDMTELAAKASVAMVHEDRCQHHLRHVQGIVATSVAFDAFKLATA